MAVATIVGGGCRSNNATMIPTEREIRLTRNDAYHEPVQFDEKGRRIVVVGDVALHVPVSVNPSATADEPRSRSLHFRHNVEDQRWLRISC